MIVRRQTWNLAAVLVVRAELVTIIATGDGEGGWKGCVGAKSFS